MMEFTVRISPTHAIEINAHNAVRGRKIACTKIRLLRVKKVCVQIDYRECA